MLLKAFALMRFNNENLVSFLYSRVAEQVKTLQTQVLCSGWRAERRNCCPSCGPL